MVALDPEDAARRMLVHGFEPIDPYPGSKKPWKCRHSKCGEIVFPRYSNVMQSNGGCPTCKKEKIKLDSSVAIEIMRKANLEPLVPYEGAQTKWDSKCLVCGSLCSPALSWIKSGQGGCIKCANDTKSKTLKGKKRLQPQSTSRILEAEALKILEKCGREPLEPYVNSRLAWKSKCKTCETVGSPTLHNLKKRGSQCVVCGRKRTNDSKKLSQSDVKKAFENVGVELLEEYPYQNSKPLKCRCLTCNRIVYPTYANVRKSKSGCKFCAGVFVDVEQAKKLMLDAGYKVIEDYPGADKPWKSIHLDCGKDCSPTYTTIRFGGGGCRTCAEYGWDNSKPSYLYFIRNVELNSFKVGIANNNFNRKSDRLHRFRNHGWEELSVWDFNSGEHVQQIEKSFFSFLRNERKIKPYLNKGTLTYQGESETFSMDSIAVQEVIDRINLAILEIGVPPTEFVKR